MISQIADFINTKLPTEKNYSLTERVTEGEKEFPAAYLSNGEYEKIEADRFRGVTWMTLGDVTSVLREDESCEQFVVRTYPIRLYGIIKRSLFNCDSQSGIYSFVDQIIRKVSVDNDAALLSSTSADQIDITSTGFRLDRNIFKEVFGSGRIKMEFAIFWIDLAVVVEIPLHCLKEC